MDIPPYKFLIILICHALSAGHADSAFNLYALQCPVMCRAFFAVVVFLPFGFSLHFGRVFDHVDCFALPTAHKIAGQFLTVDDPGV